MSVTLKTKRTLFLCVFLTHSVENSREKIFAKNIIPLRTSTCIILLSGLHDFVPEFEAVQLLNGSTSNSCKTLIGVHEIHGRMHLY